MNITLPLWLILSQWFLLFALGFLIITMYRQVGFQMRIRDLGTDKEGLSLGEVAPIFEYLPFTGKELTHFDPKGHWSILMFADPGCVSCENALVALERLLPKLTHFTHILVATSAEKAQVEAIEAFRTTTLPISQVSRDIPYKLYRTMATPFVFLIDPDGAIRAKGFILNEASLRKIVQKVPHSVLQAESVIV